MSAPGEIGEEEAAPDDVWHASVNTAIDLRSPVYFVRDENGLEVCSLQGSHAKADAETIVRHHNAHEPLFTALDQVRRFLADNYTDADMPDILPRVRQVLARWAP